MKAISEWDRLPKFLLADDGEERDFVLHCHYPRFLMEFIGQEGQPVFIDDEADFIAAELSAGREPARALARLMREAGEFFVEQINREDE